jgi:hypothetical protein
MPANNNGQKDTLIAARIADVPLPTGPRNDSDAAKGACDSTPHAPAFAFIPDDIRVALTAQGWKLLREVHHEN